jgi:hypothetical protein
LSLTTSTSARSTRRIAIASLLATVVAPGCFALFSLDSYGPGDGLSDGSSDRDAPTDAATDARDAKPPGRTIFVTGGRFTGDLGGLDGGDAKCQAAAADAGLEGAFKAWLNAGAAPESRLVLDAGPLRLPSGAIVAASVKDLATSGPMIGIALDERGNRVDGGDCDDGVVAWIGSATEPTGKASCNAWTARFGTTLVGLVGATGSTWAAACQHSCSDTAALYCLQQ